jgi:Protein of unknown function (DUF4230)
MSDYYYPPEGHPRPNTPAPKKPVSSLTYLFYFSVLFLVGAIVYRYFQTGGGGNYTSVPQDMQITYVPADFKSTLDDENALAVLSNPERYKSEFSDIVYQFNLDLLHHVANRMGLPDALKGEVEGEYKKHHPYLKQLYFNDFVALKDTNSTVYQSFYANNATNAVEALNEVASKYTCFLVNSVISAIVKSNAGKMSVKGVDVNTPCGVAMAEGLNPMIKRLQDRAAINDFSHAKGFMQEKVEKVVSELATVELRDKKGLSKQLNTKVLGYDVSTTDIEISAISILKVGFKLDRYFNLNLDNKRRTVVVTLPEPTILSHEVYPRVDKLDVGWMREITDADFNKNFNTLREQFRQEALESNVMMKAKKQATEIMDVMLRPMISNIGKGFKMEVRFQNSGTDLPADGNYDAPKEDQAGKWKIKTYPNPSKGG